MYKSTDKEKIKKDKKHVDGNTQNIVLCEPGQLDRHVILLWSHNSKNQIVIQDADIT
jgi:glucose-6-phosphate isomerase